MAATIAWIKTEPAAIVGVVQAALALAVSLGFHLSADTIGAIMAVASAVLALLVRSAVTPVAPPVFVPPAPPG